MVTNEVRQSSFCGMCGSGCPMYVYVKNGKAERVERADTAAVGACPRWQAQLDFIYHPDRILYPLRRSGKRGRGEFQRISWDEALDTIAASLQQVKTAHGAQAVAFYVAFPKEPRPYFHRLAHAFGSPNYLSESSSCFTATRVATEVTFGPDYNSFAAQGSRIDSATRCKLVWGSSIGNSAPGLWSAYVKAKDAGLKLIVVDPRRTRLAEMADFHLQLRPGTDGALALAMLNVIISEGLYDKEFVEKWTVGFDGLRQLAAAYPPDRASAVTQVPADKIASAARLFANQKPAQLAASICATTHHTNGVPNHRAILLLPAITGNLDINGGNRRQPQGRPPVDITLPERLETMAPGVGATQFSLWSKVCHEMQANVLAEQIDTAKPYAIKALLATGLNVQFFPNTKRFLASLGKLDFIAVSEYFPNSGTALADIILPVASWLERPTLFAGGTIKLVPPVITPLGECRTDFQIYAGLANRLGFGDLFWDGDFARSIDDILAPLGLTYRQLAEQPEGVKSPPPQPRPQQSYLVDGFKTPSGKVEIAASRLSAIGFDPLPVYREPPESPLSQPDLTRHYPLVLTSGARTLPYLHSQYRQLARLRRIMPDPLLEIHPSDASARGIRDGDKIVVTSPRGTARMKASVTEAILAGVVSAPHHWSGEANINALVDDVNLDPISGFPPFRSQLCQVQKDD